MTDETPEPPPRLKPRQPPPPLTRSVHGPLLPHAAVLEELASPAGVLLWRLLQDATLWSAAEASGREGLFADAAGAAAGLVPEVEEELDALGVLVRDPHPDAAPLIARMCDRVRTWAEGRGLRGTALAFAQAAALADPADARCAYEVGRLARGRAEYARAEVWYQRAVVLARRSGDAEAWARSYGGLANLYGKRGNYPAAFQAARRMARLATRHHIPEVQSGAYHGLAVLCFETGDVRTGIRHARRALGIGGTSRDSTLRVIHDMAVALMDNCGAFTVAREVLHVLVPHVAPLHERILVLANLGRAAGATGGSQLFDAIWTDSWGALGDSRDPADTDALMALARGAASLRHWDRAQLAATHAQALTAGWEDDGLRLSACALLEQIATEQRTEAGTQPNGTRLKTGEIDSFGRDLLLAVNADTPSMNDLAEKQQSAFERPGDPKKAYELGRALRLRGEDGRAVAWLERGLRLARDCGDAEAESLCLGGLGNLLAQRGEYATALEFHRVRLEHATIAGLTEMEADSLLDLCAVSFAAHQGDAGFGYARRALEVLRPGHPALPRLAHDVGVYLMESRGDFENACLLLEALRDHELPPGDKLLLEASLARAAAGAGYAQLFEDAWTTAWAATETLPVSACPPGAFIHLAHGAMSRGHHDLADKAARRALDTAKGRAEVPIIAVAESLIEAARNSRDAQKRNPAWRDASHDRKAATRLAREFVRALRDGVSLASRDTPAHRQPFGWNAEG